VSYIIIKRQCRTPITIFAELRLETYTHSIDPATSVSLVCLVNVADAMKNFVTSVYFET